MHILSRRRNDIGQDMELCNIQKMNVFSRDLFLCKPVDLRFLMSFYPVILWVFYKIIPPTFVGYGIDQMMVYEISNVNLRIGIFLCMTCRTEKMDKKKQHGQNHMTLQQLPS